MEQSDLFAPPPPGHRDGATYDPKTDYAPLNEQHKAVFEILRDGQWHTPGEIARKIDALEQSVSARIRDCRKARFGGHTVERRRAPDEDGRTTRLFEYRLVIK